MKVLTFSSRPQTACFHVVNSKRTAVVNRKLRKYADESSCHASHAMNFAVVYPQPSCCVRSLLWHPRNLGQRNPGAVYQLQQVSDGSWNISKPFCVSTGVPQGDVLAPFLFITLVDYLLLKSSDGDSGVLTCPRKSRRYPAKVLNDLDFADDIALLESSISRAQSQLTRTASAASDLGLVISSSKAEYIVINCCPQPPLEVYSSTINHVQDFKYLGSMMASSSGDFKRRKGLAWTAFWQPEHLWRCPSISISTKIKLFNTTCVTVLLYGCESWVLSKAMESEIDAFGTSCYRMMLNIERIDRVSNATIYDLT